MPKSTNNLYFNSSVHQRRLFTGKFTPFHTVNPRNGKASEEGEMYATI